MKLVRDVIPCTVARSDFQRWLDEGKGPFTVCNGSLAAILLKLKKTPLVDYLYKIDLTKGGGISWDHLMEFCGAYDTKCRSLYLTGDSLGCLTHGPAPIAAADGLSMTRELCGKINRRVEEIIANGRNNLSIQEVTDPYIVQQLQDYRNHSVKNDAIHYLFKGQPPDMRFHSNYETLNRLAETAFMAYLQDPDGFIRAEAEQYIKHNQEKLLMQFLRNDALAAEYHALMQDAGNPIHRMRIIAEIVKGITAKKVRVTVQKNGQELTFSVAPAALTGYGNHYSKNSIPAQSRREFDRLFGRHEGYTADDIIRITYCKKPIYEAPTAQTEEMAECTGMEGMRFG